MLSAPPFIRQRKAFGKDYFLITPDEARKYLAPRLEPSVACRLASDPNRAGRLRRALRRAHARGELFAMPYRQRFGSSTVCPPVGQNFHLSPGPAVVNNWHGAAWSPSLGIFAIGSSTTDTSTSANGETWTAIGANGGQNFDMAWSPSAGVFCSVITNINDTVMTSPDGLAWTNRAMIATAGPWRSIDYISTYDRFYSGRSVCSANAIQDSADGVAWTLRATPNFGGANWMAGFAGSPALSVISVGGGTAKRIMRAFDGVTWVEVPGIIPLGVDMVDCAYNPFYSRYYAFGTAGAGNNLYSDDDGLNWNTAAYGAAAATNQSGTFSENTGNMIQGGIASNNRIQYSIDGGLTWNLTYTGASVSVRRLAYSPALSLFISVGDGNLFGVYPE